MTTRGQLVIKALASNRQIAKRYLSFIQKDYFETTDDRLIFTAVKSFIDTYAGMPSKDAIELAIEDLPNISDSRLPELVKHLDTIWKIDAGSNIEYLNATIEEFVKDRALFNAIMEASSIYGGEIDKPKEAIHTVVADALSIAFDNYARIPFKPRVSTTPKRTSTARSLGADLRWRF